MWPALCTFRPDATWSPTNQAGIQAWADTTDLSKRVGSGPTFTQLTDSTGALTYTANAGSCSLAAIGNKTGYVLSGTQSLRRGTAVTYTSGQPRTMMAVFITTFNSGSNGQGLFGSAANGAEIQINNMTVGACSGYNNATSNPPFVTSADTVTINVWQSLVVRYDPAGLGNYISLRGGTPVTSVTSNTNPSCAFSNPWVGADAAFPNNGLSGVMGECIFYSASVTNAIIDKFCGYAAWKYNGNGLTLPVAHPYRNFPPPP